MDGKNENFERPILIIRKIKEDNFLCIPMTSQKKLDIPLHTFLYKDKEYYFYLDHIRYLNIKRLLRLIVRVEEEEFRIIKKKVIDFLI